MAAIATSRVPEARYQPYVGLPELQRAQSGIARAEVIYSDVTAWAAPGAGNTAYIEFDINLDNNYGYVLTDMSCWMFRPTAFSAEAVGRVFIRPDSTRPSETFVCQLISHAGRMDAAGSAIGSVPADEFNTMGVTNTGYEMSWNLETKPTYLIYPYSAPGKGSSIVEVMFADPEINSFSKTVYFMAKFLQYDISQGYNWAINSPVVVR